MSSRPPLAASVRFACVILARSSDARAAMAVWRFRLSTRCDVARTRFSTVLKTDATVGLNAAPMAKPMEKEPLDMFYSAIIHIIAYGLIGLAVLAFAAMLLGQAAEALYSACAFLRRLTCLRH